MIVYVETNLLMGRIKGQEAEAWQLLQQVDPPIRFVMPDVCILEVQQAFRRFMRRRERLVRRLDDQIHDLQRDRSPQAQSVYSLLNQARLEWESVGNEMTARYFDTIAAVAAPPAGMPPIDLAAVTPAAVQGSLGVQLSPRKLKPADLVILHVIIDHASRESDPQKFFLSANSKDFRQPEVQGLLNPVGVKYVSHPRAII
jgi:hypothetical protein